MVIFAFPNPGKDTAGLAYPAGVFRLIWLSSSFY